MGKWHLTGIEENVKIIQQIQPAAVFLIREAGTSRARGRDRFSLFLAGRLYLLKGVGCIMAGIAGCIGHAPAEVHAMLSALANRGSGSATVTVHQGITLGCIGTPDTAMSAWDEYRGVIDGEFYAPEEPQRPAETSGTAPAPVSAEEVPGEDDQPGGYDWLLDYAALGPAMVEKQQGVFALAAVGPDGLWLARDPLGVKPLYYGFDDEGRLWFASQIKPLLGRVRQPEEFPPGHYYDSNRGFQQYYDLPPPTGNLQDLTQAKGTLRRRLQRAIRRRLQGPETVGVMLSGGLDSSLCAAMAMEALEGDSLPSFAMGMAGSDDLVQARAVARDLGTRHHQREVKPEEIITVLPTIIEDLESFDAAVVRGAVANHFAAQLAREHVDAVITGEGADELFAGYHYLKHPRIRERLEKELQRIVRSGSRTTLQRLDRMTSRHQLVPRLPFLDLDVVNFAWRVPSRWKLNPREEIEKWILRHVAESYLSADIVWRTKAKFALGTGVGPFLAAYAEDLISTAEFQREREPLPGLILRDREELLYYRIFRDIFGNRVRDILPVMGRSPSLNDEAAGTPV